MQANSKVPIYPDLAGATELTSEQSGARRYLRLDRTSTEFSAIRAYTFPGSV